MSALFIVGDGFPVPGCVYSQSNQICGNEW